MNDFVDPAGLHADVLREAVLADSHRLEEILQEHLAGVYRGKTLSTHDVHLMVVHEPDIAARVRRRLTLCDVLNG
jgi:hypothetical protein